jgi:phosphohistidine phosphatase
MAKTLYLIRHAKSDWSVSGQKDFDRSLNSRGIQDAPMMGKLFKSLHVNPELIISSPAIRAKETAEFVAEQLGYSIDKIKYDEEIYEASPRTLLRYINNLDNKVNNLAMFGHNPTFTYLAEYLSNEQLGNIPTCGAVKLHFELDDWTAVTQATSKMVWFEFPKKHKSD